MVAQHFSPEERQALIAYVTERLADVSPQFGKTVLMKMMYLLQEVKGLPLGYRFGFYTYGPYSTEVLSDLDAAERHGGVKVEFQTTDGYGYKISPGQKLDEVIANWSELGDKFEEAVAEVTKQFGTYSAKDLELRTTIIYVWRNSATGKSSNAESVAELVQELKPHFSKQQILHAVKELAQAKLLN
jgi:uncharacterized protein YwgA